MLPKPSYVRYDDSVEIVQPDEEATVGEVLAVFHTLQAFTFEKHRHAVRAAHAKSHGVLRGELTVYGGLAELAADVVRAVGAGDPTGLIGQGTPETHILGETYYTTAPLRYGDYLAKLAVVPVSEALQPLVGQHVETSDPAVLRDLVVAFFREQGAEYELRAQLCVDLATMPVEDAAVRWPEDAREGGAPYQPVARLTIPAQEAYSPARRVYDASARFRQAMNASPAREPRTIDELPA